MKKEKSMAELLAKIDLERIKRVGASEDDLNKVRALHAALLEGKTWEDEEIRQLFGVLPDCFPFGACFVSNEILVRIGKASPIKVVARPNDSCSRTRWVPANKAEELGVPIMSPSLHGYEVKCSGGCGTFFAREIWHISFCEKCRYQQKKSKPKPTMGVEPVKSAMVEQVVSLSSEPEKPKKRRGRPPKDKSDKKDTKRSKKPEKSSVRPSKGWKTTKKRNK